MDTVPTNMDDFSTKRSLKRVVNGCSKLVQPKY